MLPTAELAHHAGLANADYTKQIVNACFLNRREPVNNGKRCLKMPQRLNGG
jgi:hypothetical protein